MNEEDAAVLWLDGHMYERTARMRWARTMARSPDFGAPVPRDELQQAWFCHKRDDVVWRAVPVVKI